jgi:hypothetical protein
MLSAWDATAGRWTAHNLNAEFYIICRRRCRLTFQLLESRDLKLNHNHNYYCQLGCELRTLLALGCNSLPRMGATGHLTRVLI